MLTLHHRDILGFDLYTEIMGPQPTTGYLLSTPALRPPMRQHGNVTTTARVIPGQVLMMEGDAFNAVSVDPVEFLGRQVFKVKVATL